MVQKRISKEEVDGLKTFLATLPELENAPNVTFSGQQVVAELKAEIMRLMKKGYSLVNIAEMMTKQGFEIKSPTLKTYLSRAGGKKKVTARETRRVMQSAVPPENIPGKAAVTNLGGATGTADEQPQKGQGVTAGKFSVRPDSAAL